TATPAAPPTRPPQPGRPTPVPRVTAAPTPQGGQYKNGTFVGPAARTVYGPVQVQAVIENGRIFDIQFLTYPQARRTSVQINQQVVPILRNEALQIQSANVHAITGATLTVDAFIESLNGALAQARP
ncbi:MAG: FMN-binding protein, partial [Thermoflexales bacterium]|nr:FMN-binding protein [Thermoflexales bacterium]